MEIIPVILLVIALIAKDIIVRFERRDLQRTQAKERDRLLNRIQDPETAVWQSISDGTPDEDKPMGPVELTQAEDGEMHLVGQVLQGDFKKPKDDESA